MLVLLGVLTLTGMSRGAGGGPGGTVRGHGDYVHRHLTRKSLALCCAPWCRHQTCLIAIGLTQLGPGVFFRA
jgi:hypothetical protein